MNKLLVFGILLLAVCSLSMMAAAASDPDELGIYKTPAAPSKSIVSEQPLLVKNGSSLVSIAMGRISI